MQLQKYKKNEYGTCGCGKATILKYGKCPSCYFQTSNLDERIAKAEEIFATQEVPFHWVVEYTKLCEQRDLLSKEKVV